MADKQQLQRLIDHRTSGWSHWRNENPDVVPDLSGADLSGADLSEANLFRANLGGAHLSGANLNFANLIVANLSGANLSRANLSGANLSGANLGQANLSRAHLSGANLSGANLYRANLSGANLNGADLSQTHLLETVFGNSNLTEAKGLDTCTHHGPSILDHRTMAQSGPLPLSFLRGCGLPDKLVEYLPSLLNQAIEFYSCFISYSHKDKVFARRLYDALQGRGVRCWLDEKQLLPGDDIYEHIDRGIRLWDKVLLCCSEHSLTSWWVDDEISKAFAKEQKLMEERKDKILALIPLDLDGYLLSGWKSGKAPQIRTRLAADFRGWQNSHVKCEEQIDKVSRALRSDAHAREQPPKSKL